MFSQKKFFLGLITLILLAGFYSCSENNINQKAVDNYGEQDDPVYMNSLYPDDRFYTENHEWVKIGDQSVALVGITMYPLNFTGNIIDGEPLPSKGGQTGIPGKKKVMTLVGELSFYDVEMPVYGDIDLFNPELDINPGIVNLDPYGAGWLFQISNFNIEELKNLMTADEYTAYVEGL